MKIKHIHIKNFKSIKNLDIDLIDINAFIGANNAGKSNIFSAINFLLGRNYPMPANITKEIHYNGDIENKIYIRIEFNDSKFIEFFEGDEKKDDKSGLYYNGEKYRMKGDDRDKYCIAYLDTERKVNSTLPSNKWSLMGKILYDINKEFSSNPKLVEDFNEKAEDLFNNTLLNIESFKNFSNKLSNYYNSLIKNTDTKFSLELKNYDPWNYYKNIEILISDGANQFLADSCGMGFQSIISIAVLRAYGELQLSKETKSPIFIEEPEIFLHPQAQRKFHKILKDLANNHNIQIFYNTHSPNFIDFEYFDQVFLTRKDNKEGTYVKNCKISDLIEDLNIRRREEGKKGKDIEENGYREQIKYNFEETCNSKQASEAFFANKIILVEGQSENTILKYLFKMIEFDLDDNNISIVECGCKNEIDRYYRIYTEFGIPVFVIFDSDKQIKEDDKKNKKDIEENERENLVLFELLCYEYNDNFYGDNQVKNNFLSFEYDLGKFLEFDTKTKGLKLLNQLKNKIESIQDKSSNNYYKKIENMIKDIKDNLEKLEPLKNSVLKRYNIF